MSHGGKNYKCDSCGKTPDKKDSKRGSMIVTWDIDKVLAEICVCDECAKRPLDELLEEYERKHWPDLF